MRFLGTGTASFTARSFAKGNLSDVPNGRQYADIVDDVEAVIGAEDFGRGSEPGER